MEFNQLLIADVGELSEDQASFVRLHNSIVTHSQMAASHVVLMAKDFKEMRDEKKYLAAGFDSFGEYTQSACNIKERQAYNYIQILEKLPEDFLQSTAKIGITKLQLLAGLTDEERAVVVGTDINALESIKVKELEAQIELIKNEKEAKQRQLDIFSTDMQVELDKLENAKEQLKADKLTLQQDLHLPRRLSLVPTALTA